MKRRDLDIGDYCCPEVCWVSDFRSTSFVGFPVMILLTSDNKLKFENIGHQKFELYEAVISSPSCGATVKATGEEVLRINLLQPGPEPQAGRSEEHTSELQSPCNLVCRLLLEKKKQSL